MRMPIYVLGACLLAGCSPSADDAGVTSDQLPHKPTTRSTPASSEAEARLIERDAPLVIRQGRTLRLTLESGKTLDLVNSEQCESYETCQIHEYGGLLIDQKFFYVETRLYEGSYYALYSRVSGESTRIYDVPHVSPDGKFVVTASASEAHDDSGVFIWEVRDRLLVQRHAQDHATNLLYRFIRWDGPRRVALERTDFPTDGACKGGSLQVPVYAVLEEGEFWKLETEADTSKYVCSK